MARQTASRVEAGAAQPADGQLAAADLRSAKANFERRRETVAKLTRQLDILLRDYPDCDVATATMLPRTPPKPPAGMAAELLARRPDIAASLRASRPPASA